MLLRPTQLLMFGGSKENSLGGWGGARRKGIFSHTLHGPEVGSGTEPAKQRPLGLRYCPRLDLGEYQQSQHQWGTSSIGELSGPLKLIWLPMNI